MLLVVLISVSSQHNQQPDHHSFIRFEVSSPQSSHYAENIYTGIVATLAMYCYEWLITLDQEVKFFWTGKQTLATWIFAVSRYSTLFLVILTIPPTLTHDVRYPSLDILTGLI